MTKRQGKSGTIDVKALLREDEEFLRALANNANLTLHLTVEAGTNAHHIIEASFKALARSLRTAVSIDPKQQGVPSTKGTLTQ